MKTQRYIWTMALAGLALWTTGSGVRAETATDGKLQELDQKVRILERKLEIADEAFSGGYAQSSRAAKSAEAVGGGFNWYLSNNARFSVDYEQTSFDGGAASGDRPEEKVVIARAQVTF